MANLGRPVSLFKAILNSITAALERAERAILPRIDEDPLRSDSLPAFLGSFENNDLPGPGPAFETRKGALHFRLTAMLVQRNASVRNLA